MKKSKINKRGVFAERDFKVGEIVLKWKSKKVLTREKVDKLPEEDKRYVSAYTKDEYIFQGEPERYVNHSCDSNTKVVKRCDVAIRNINKGEEITSDYIEDSLGTLKPFRCTCGSKDCKKEIK